MSPVKLYLCPPSTLIYTQCITQCGADLKEYSMYTVTVQWGDLVKTHKAWTLSSAKEWMYTYPNKDVFAKVTNVFGSTVAVRYKR